MPSPNTVDFGEDLTDQQIFDNATANTPPAEPEPQVPEQTPEPQEAPVAPVETTGGRLKDPVTGKFVAKEAQPQAQPQEAERPINADELPASEAEPEIEPQMPAQVPSWRLAEEATRRREAEAQNYAAQQQIHTLQMQMAQWQEQQQKAQAEPVDPISNPMEYAQAIRQEYMREMSQFRLETNLQMAQARHKETFDKAYQAFLDNTHAGDAATYRSVMDSPNQGEALVRWYVNRETLNRVGPDPEAFLQAERERLLNDPAFQAEAIKRVQAQNGSTPSNSQVKLPPSLSRVSSAAPAAEGELDTSDAAVYQRAIGRR